MRVRIRLVGLVAVIALVSSGCIWPQFRWDASHSGSNPIETALNIVNTTNVGSLTTKWTTTTGGPVRSSPAVGLGVLYVGSSDAKVYALNAATGAVLWTTTTGGAVH
ncbi:MAG: PQQ-binding-like beta-propeller repeat protein, partial [Acidimicrobiia bacterium]|nr:PQQ-binding-like beta-propeller repeat protein [Acidimicrobiia bacterium]